VRFVIEHLAEQGLSWAGLAFGEVEFGELDAGTGIGVVFGDLLPEWHGGVEVGQGGKGFGQGHQGMAVVVMGVFAADRFKQGARFGRAALAEEALAEVGSGFEVLGVALKGGAVSGFGFREFAPLEVDIAQLQVKMGFVEMMDLGLELADATAVDSAGQFKAAGGGGGLQIDQEEVEQGGWE
jgi:hypothetical protein